MPFEHLKVDAVDAPLDGTGVPGEAEIAAICRARGATLATRNLRDFRKTGINLIDLWLSRTVRG
jgi:toxin FitB